MTLRLELLQDFTWCSRWCPAMLRAEQVPVSYVSRGEIVLRWVDQHKWPFDQALLAFQSLQRDGLIAASSLGWSLTAAGRQALPAMTGGAKKVCP